MPFNTVNELDQHLATRSYVEGYSLSDADRAALSALGGVPCKASTPHAFRWAVHVMALIGVEKYGFVSY